MEISKIDPWELPRFRTPAAKPKQGLLKRIWESWKRLGMGLGKVNLYIVLFIIYWTVFAITAIIAKILGRDWLELKAKTKNYWHEHPEPANVKDEHYRQF